MPRKPPARRDGRDGRNGRDDAPPPVVGTGFAYHFRPRNRTQREALDVFPGVDVLGLVGPAGTGKSVLAAALALAEILHKRAERLTVIRPCVEAAEHPLGWLAGGLDEKLLPHYAAFGEAVHRISFGFPEKLLRRLAVSFLRGLTFSDEVVIVDEAQNLTLRELRLVVSRLGERAKLLVVGDPEQTDIGNSGLVEFFRRLDGAPGIARLDFGDADVVRHPRMGEWLRRLR